MEAPAGHSHVAAAAEHKVDQVVVPHARPVGVEGRRPVQAELDEPQGVVTAAAREIYKRIHIALIAVQRDWHRLLDTHTFHTIPESSVIFIIRNCFRLFSQQTASIIPYKRQITTCFTDILFSGIFCCRSPPGFIRGRSPLTLIRRRRPAARGARERQV